MSGQLRRNIDTQAILTAIDNNQGKTTFITPYNKVTKGLKKKTVSYKLYGGALLAYAKAPHIPQNVLTMSTICGSEVAAPPSREFDIPVDGENLKVRFPVTGREFKFRVDNIPDQLDKIPNKGKLKELNKNLRATGFFANGPSHVGYRWSLENNAPNHVMASLCPNFVYRGDQFASSKKAYGFKLLPKGVPAPPGKVQCSQINYAASTSINVFSREKNRWDVASCLGDCFFTTGNPMGAPKRFSGPHSTCYIATSFDRTKNNLPTLDTSEFSKNFREAYWAVFQSQFDEKMLDPQNFYEEGVKYIMGDLSTSPGLPYLQFDKSFNAKLQTLLGIYSSEAEAVSSLIGENKPTQMVNKVAEVVPLILRDFEALTETLFNKAGAAIPLTALVAKLKEEGYDLEKAMTKPRTYFVYPRAIQAAIHVLIQPLTLSQKDQDHTKPESFSAYGYNYMCPKKPGDGVDLYIQKKRVAEKYGFASAIYGDDNTTFYANVKGGYHRYRKHAEKCQKAGKPLPQPELTKNILCVSTDVSTNDQSRNVIQAQVVQGVALYPWTKPPSKDLESSVQEGKRNLFIQPGQVSRFLDHIFLLDNRTVCKFFPPPDTDPLKFNVVSHDGLRWGRGAGTLCSGQNGTTQFNNINQLACFVYYALVTTKQKPTVDNIVAMIRKDWKKVIMPDYVDVIYEWSKHQPLKNHLGDIIKEKKDVLATAKESEQSFLKHTPTQFTWPSGEKGVLMARSREAIIKSIFMCNMKAPQHQRAAMVFSAMLEAPFDANLFYAFWLLLQQPEYGSCLLDSDMNEYLTEVLLELGLTLQDLDIEDAKTFLQLTKRFDRTKCLHLRCGPKDYEEIIPNKTTLEGNPEFGAAEAVTQEFPLGTAYGSRRGQKAEGVTTDFQASWGTYTEFDSIPVTGGIQSEFFIAADIPSVSAKPEKLEKGNKPNILDNDTLETLAQELGFDEPELVPFMREEKKEEEAELPSPAMTGFTDAILAQAEEEAKEEKPKPKTSAKKPVAKEKPAQTQAEYLASVGLEGITEAQFEALPELWVNHMGLTGAGAVKEWTKLAKLIMKENNRELLPTLFALGAFVRSSGGRGTSKDAKTLLGGDLKTIVKVLVKKVEPYYPEDQSDEEVDIMAALGIPIADGGSPSSSIGEITDSDQEELIEQASEKREEIQAIVEELLGE